MANHQYTFACPVIVEDGNKCAEEMLVEYDVWQETFETGNRFCHMCERTEGEVEPGVPCSMDLCLEELTPEQLENAEHEWVMEIDERNCWQFISLTTYCWHVVSKAQIQELMDEDAAAYAEKVAVGE